LPLVLWEIDIMEGKILAEKKERKEMRGVMME